VRGVAEAHDRAVSTLATPPATIALVDGGVRLDVGGRIAVLHPQWLRDRSTEPGQVDRTNRQRLYTPLDLPGDLVVVGYAASDGAVVAEFSDGHRATYALDALMRALGWLADAEAPPAPEPWSAPLDPLAYVDWAGIGWDAATADPDAVIAYLDGFFRFGFAVLRGTPTELGTVRRVADRLGYISGNNFGWVFDVRAEATPTDLAYTPIALSAHTDQPYRRPVPGIQLLHCLRNDAPGGDSTLVDGLAAAVALAADDPDAHAALAGVETEWRYDTGDDTVVGRGRVLEYEPDGRFHRIRFSTKLDSPVPSPGVDLAAYYRGRRRLAEWLDDPAHRLVFRLEPGDVVVFDNHRLLHGRTAFDPSLGSRHLQGCYIDHDGPDTMYRLAVRRRASMSR